MVAEVADVRWLRPPPIPLLLEQHAQVVARYEAAETSTALATEYRVAKSTILGILRANNAVLRRQPLTTEQVSEAARLCESGVSLSQVAERLSIDQETVRVAILNVGVALSPPTTAKSM